jgi:hypothetical protein
MKVVGVDPGLHNFGVSVLQDYTILLMDRIDLCPGLNANRVKVESVLDSMVRALEPENIASHMNSADKILVERQPMNGHGGSEKVRAIAYALFVKYWPRVQFVDKRTYAPFLCTGAYAGNKNLANTLLKDILPNAGEDRMHDTTEALLLAYYGLKVEGVPEPERKGGIFVLKLDEILSKAGIEPKKPPKRTRRKKNDAPAPTQQTIDPKTGDPPPHLENPPCRTSSERAKGGRKRKRSSSP